jgi:hypothetical protein
MFFNMHPIPPTLYPRQQANLKSFVRNGANHSIATDWADEALKHHMVRALGAHWLRLWRFLSQGVHFERPG